MEFGKGYQVYINKKDQQGNPVGVEVEITGDIPDPDPSLRGADGTEAISTLELKQGWNLIAAPTTDSVYLKDALNNLKEGVDYDKIRECTDPKNNTFKKPLFLKKGRAYYIHCLKDTTWKIPAYADRTNFAYDGDGGRLNYITKNDITTYVGSLYEEKLDGSATKHIYFGSTRITSITTPAGQPAKAIYYHSDHLGSSNILTDSDGNAIRRTEYKPYGEIFNNWEADPDSEMPNFFFTGKRLDEDTGLYYYGARYYDPKLGRFTQADTIVPSPGNPQSFNRYSYTDNNPINYIDPTGHWSWKKFGHSVLAGFVGGVVTALTGGLAAPLALMWGGMAAGATMGAFEGGVKGALIGAGIGAFMGANIGAGIAMFGSGFGYAAIGAAAIYTGATQGWEGLGYMMGGTLGGMGGYQVGSGLRSVFPSNTRSQINTNRETISKGIRNALNTDLSDDVGSKFGKSALESWDRRVDIHDTVEAYQQFGSQDMKLALGSFRSVGGRFEYDPTYRGTAYYDEFGAEIGKQVIAFGRGNWENPWPGYTPGKSGLERSLPHEIYHFMHHDTYPVEERIAQIYGPEQRRILIRNRGY